MLLLLGQCAQGCVCRTKQALQSKDTSWQKAAGKDEASGHAVCEVSACQQGHMRVTLLHVPPRRLSVCLTTSSLDCAELPLTGGGTSTRMFSTPLALSLSIMASRFFLYSHTLVFR